MTGGIFVISAPSGTGKTTIARLLREAVPDLALSVSYTTRPPRPGERDGVDYRFVSRRRFEGMLARGELAEWAEVYGNLYGTGRKPLEDALRAGRPILLTIDTQGGLQVRKAFPSAVLIGLLPPSIEEQERRMRRRDGMDERSMRNRLAASREERRILREHYDFRVVNRDLAGTVARIRTIMARTLSGLRSRSSA